MEAIKFLLTDKLMLALQIAVNSHSGQSRRGLKDPYILHLMEVFHLVCSVTPDEDTRIGSILHDAPEDKSLDLLDVIEEHFGKRVRDIVESLTDDHTLTGKAQKAAQLEKLRQAEQGAHIIKAADVISKICTRMKFLRTTTLEHFIAVYDGIDQSKKVSTIKKKIAVMEEVWPENPLLWELRERFEQYKKLLTEKGLLPTTADTSA